MSNTIIGEYIIFVNTSLIDTLVNYMKPYYTLKNIEINSSNYIQKTNEFIARHEELLIELKSIIYNLFFSSPYTNVSCFNVIENNTDYTSKFYKYDENMTLYEYIVLLHKMTLLYDESFNINYNLTCPDKYNFVDEKKGYEIKNIYENKNSPLVTQTNVFCKYYKIKDEKGNITIEPVFIGSYLLMNQTVFIYNICSNISKFNKKYDITKYGFELYRSSTLFNIMLNLFQHNTSNKRFALFVETRNPSYTKAYSLYYKSGFRPLINLLDTVNINVLDIALNCSPLSSNYKDCQKGTFPMILMMKSSDPNDTFINFYNDNFMSISNRNFNKISRVSSTGNKLRYFFDTAISMAYRCSCVFDKYYLENKDICENIVDSVTEYFTNNSDFNTQHFSEIWNNITTYEIDSIKRLKTGSSSPIDIHVLSNKNLFRFISSVNLNYSEFIYNSKTSKKNTLYCDFTLIVKIKEESSITGKIKKIINIIFRNNKSILSETNISSFEINDISDILKVFNTGSNRSDFKKIVSGFTRYNFNDDKYPIIFIPCSVHYESNVVGSGNSLNHAVSMIFFKKTKKLYFYESQVVFDSSLDMLKETVKSLAIVTKEMLRIMFNDVNSVDDKVYEIHRYKDPETSESLYSKIQSTYADDPTGGLCVLLSRLPFIACNLLNDPTIEKSDEYIKFFIFMLTFYSIKIKVEQHLTNIINPVHTNISVIFPYVFLGIPGFIKNLNEYKKNNNIKIYNEDTNLENKLNLYKTKLEKNLDEVNDILQSILTNKQELTHSFF